MNRIKEAFVLVHETIPWIPDSLQDKLCRAEKLLQEEFDLQRRQGLSYDELVNVLEGQSEIIKQLLLREKEWMQKALKAEEKHLVRAKIIVGCASIKELYGIKGWYTNKFRKRG